MALDCPSPKSQFQVFTVPGLADEPFRKFTIGHAEVLNVKFDVQETIQPIVTVF